MQRNKKSISLIYLVCGFITWLLFREIMATAWVTIGIPMPYDWFISPPDLIAAAVGVAMFIALYVNAKVNEFTNDVITELSRVTWPNKKETVLSTGVVSILVGICSLIFFFFDMLWGSLVKVFYR